MTPRQRSENMAPVLDRPELKQRIVAARKVAGLSQNEMTARVEAQGFKKHAAARLERGEQDVAPSPSLIGAVALVLGFPVRWFQVPREDLWDAPTGEQALDDRLHVLQHEQQESLRLLRELHEVAPLPEPEDELLQPPPEQKPTAEQHRRPGSKRAGERRR
jgi:transcriptional regulator with XRE-family HTH domain